MKTTIAVCVVGCLLAAGGCAQRSQGVPPSVAPPLAPGAKLLRFDATMHSRSPELTFHFVGTVERQGTSGTGYDYLLRSTVVIEKDERTFPPAGVRLTSAVLSAGVTADGHSQGRRILLEVTRRISVRLRKPGEKITLPELRFTVPAGIVAQSDFVSVVLTDGHLQVQVIPNLKGRKAFD